MSNVVMGNLYDLNKSVLASAKGINPLEAIENQSENLTNFFTKGKYFMLLCNELKDYTVFCLTTNKKVQNAKEELQVCIENRGELLGLDPTEDGIAFEIWMRVEDKIYVYYLFPYDAAIIEC